MPAWARSTAASTSSCSCSSMAGTRTRTMSSSAAMVATAAMCGATPASTRSAAPGPEGNLLALHPTVKPVALVADALRDCSSRGEIVLDAFLGSGTTLIAAERTGRNCRGLELDPAYVDTAIRRWQALTGQHARHAESGLMFNEAVTEIGEAA